MNKKEMKFYKIMTNIHTYSINISIATMEKYNR